MILLGWDITIRRVHSSSDCPICIMENLRRNCPDVSSADRYMPRHSQCRPYGIEFSALCGLGNDCRCLKQGEDLARSFGP